MDAGRPQWPMFKDLLRRQALMEDMMERCGVDLLEVVRIDRGRSFAEARAKCRACLSAMTCRRWLLASGRSDAAAPPGFCPNAELFRTCLKATTERQMRELATLASKLRWMGMEKEAARLQNRAAHLQRQQTIHFGKFLDSPLETD